MVWDEWEQLKQEAAQQHEHGTQMQLNQLPPGDGPGPSTSTSSVTKGLLSSKKAWNKAGEDIGGLGGDVDKAVRKLQDGQQGLGDVAGCLSAGAQKEVYESWASYLKGVDDRCDRVKKVFEQIGHDLLMTDEAVRSALGAIDTRFADTPAVGGQTSGR
ncbi:hypothetical protein [Streptomyces sp. NPDC016626]|uniref:hypothetical protein n=1 Tax=Streptomyces sp. NPDC016626 TaxID=3364968 RepID=UPI0036FE4314